MNPVVTLTALNEFDIDLLASWKNDRALSALMAAQPVPHSKEQVRDWLKATQTDNRQIIFGLVAEQENSKSLIGIIRFMNIDWISRVAEFGMYIGSEDLRGKSYGRASLAAALSYAFSELNVHRIWLRVISSNKPALKIYEHIGFKQEGFLREHLFANGSYQDMVLMAILRSEYKPPQAL